jgi:glycosyltransferase involved in cell wall biosynthesis
LPLAPPAGYSVFVRTLSVVIPVYNEQATIQELIRRVILAAAAAISAPIPLSLEILVSNDGSTDDTSQILNELKQAWNTGTLHAFLELEQAPLSRFLVLHQSLNQGKGAALRAAFSKVKGDYVLIQDADLEYDPRDYGRLLRPLLEGRADVVYGSRFLATERRVLFFWHAVGNSFLTLVSNAITDLNLTDMETGYKAFRREVIDRLHIQSDRFGVEPEITAKVARLGCRVYEIPISYSGRSYAEGKKITWKDGLEALYCIIRFGPLAQSSDWLRGKTGWPPPRR